MKFIILISVLLLVLPAAGAITKADKDTISEETIKETETTEPEASESETVAPVLPWKPEPTEALWRSGVLAGWGQFYNDEWFKGVLMLGAELATVYGIVYHADQAAQEKSLAEDYFDSNGTQPDLERNSQLTNEHLQNFEDHRVAYETHIWLTALVVIYSMLDAYVDAHLYDFEVGEELSKETVSYSLSPRLLPDSRGELSLGLEFSLTF